MNYKKLKKFDTFLREKSENYLSMVGVGSTVTEDPYIEGRTDKDILLIFNEDITKDNISIVTNISKKVRFDESYVFTPVSRTKFEDAESKYSFSNAFRSKTLYGEDIIGKAKLPSKRKTREIYSNGLKSSTKGLYKLIINSDSWPIERVRDKGCKQFKNIFTYLAMREYFLSKRYPKTRNDITKSLDSAEVEEAFQVLHSINMQPKRSIVKCANDVIDYIKKIEK